MSKNKIITTLIVIAAICSALAGYLIYRFLSPQRSTIYVFNSAYSAGDQITEDMLTPIVVDSSITVAGAKDSVSSRFVTPRDKNSIVTSGDSLRMDVSEGMPLTTAMLSVKGGSTVEMNMQSDMVAVTIPVDRFTGITNDLREGARVNVYTIQEGVTILIQQNKRILEVFKSDGNIIGVSIEETMQDSMELIGAVTNGSIYLGLIDATGYQASEGDEKPHYSLDISKYLPEDMQSSSFVSQSQDPYLVGEYGVQQQQTEPTAIEPMSFGSEDGSEEEGDYGDDESYEEEPVDDSVFVQ